MNGFQQMNLALAAAGVLCSGVAHAALHDRGGGLLYDDVLNITWLQDANYAKTSGYDADGRMTWYEANIWANYLVYGGFDDWRLPTVMNRDGSGICFDGYNCTNSEMGHMFYNNMGASASTSILSGSNTANLALVTNLKIGTYWYREAYDMLPTEYAWDFSTFQGLQSAGAYQPSDLYAWAVRPGDVAAPIPEPETYAMMLAGLGLLGVMARRRKQKAVA